MNSGVGLPGIQSLGTQIASMGGAITTAGGTAGIDTTAVSSAISSLGTQLSSITSISGASSLLAGLTGQLSSLTGLLNPAGGLATILHSHALDAAQGITHSAFSGQHTVNLGSAGIAIQSALKVAHTAPQLPHNGLTMVSDALNVTKGITGQSFSMLSDRRLKTRIRKHPPVLGRLLKLKVKTFFVKMFDFEFGKVMKGKPKASRGLIAQEFQEHFPELVNTEGKFLSIDIDGLTMMILSGLIEHVSESRKEIAGLKAQIARLQQ
jgi:endosialidase-like protein